MADMAKELLAAKLKLENAVTELVNEFQKSSGVQVNWMNFSRRDTGDWPNPVVFSSVDISLDAPKSIVG